MIRIRAMTFADIPCGMRLKSQAGWNQTESDWRRMLTLAPGGCFVAELDTQPVGTVATCLFDSVAWIAMVLVQPTARGRGIGTQLVEHALEYLAGRGIGSVRLDATDLGRPIYQRLGFVAQYALGRMEGHAWNVNRPVAIRPVCDDLLSGVVDLDRQATGTNRRLLLEHLLRQEHKPIWLAANAGRTVGYATFREGSRAMQIGPAVAETAEAGRDVLDAAACLSRNSAGRAIVIDVPLDNAAALDWAESRGLTVQRHFTRMCRGEPVQDHPELIWASSGPEKG